MPLNKTLILYPSNVTSENPLSSSLGRIQVGSSSLAGVIAVAVAAVGCYRPYAVISQGRPLQMMPGRHGGMRVRQIRL